MVLSFASEGDGHGGEAGVLQQLAEGEADVVHGK
jgi:hypothetical protein